MDWNAVKEHAQKWYGKVAHFLLFQNIVMYVFGCIIAREPIGLLGYIGFLNHCCQWGGR
jgi:hypothetical protein